MKFPGKFESSNVSRGNVGREIGRTKQVPRTVLNRSFVIMVIIIGSNQRELRNAMFPVFIYQCAKVLCRYIYIYTHTCMYTLIEKERETDINQ